jgi:predicted enzyme involved in methoxymalonyl-ACP biosynthesis
VFTAKVRDRFGDHGLVGAAVIRDGEILGFALSCRVLALGVEKRFVDAIAAALAGDCPALHGRIIETSRNMPVRNLFRDNGFAQTSDGVWRRDLGDPQVRHAAAS